MTRRRMRARKEVGHGTKEAIAEALQRNLTAEEIRRIAASAVLDLDPAARTRLIGRLGPETGGALDRLLKGGGGGRSRGTAHVATPSEERIRKDWKRAWSEWDRCVSESGDKDGKYVVQEHHWEEPYFDGSALADDLEPIAKRMWKVLPRVFDGDLDPGFSFAEAIAESADEIGTGLPEWIDPSAGDGTQLGPVATGCLLEWEWRRRGGTGGTHSRCLMRSGGWRPR